jgi:hypothetical protein
MKGDLILLSVGLTLRYGLGANDNIPNGTCASQSTSYMFILWKA